jgi:hypothetical protein
MAFLEENSVCRWNALEHVTGNVLHLGARRSIGHNVIEIQHAAPDVRERIRDGQGYPAEPSDDVDQLAHPSEDIAALLDDDVHDEGAVGDHASLKSEPKAAGSRLARSHGFSPCAVSKRDGSCSGKSSRLSHAPRPKKGDTKVPSSISTRKGLTLGEPTRRRDAGVRP